VLPRLVGIALNSDPPARKDLIRLTALIEMLIPTAERIDGALVDEALMADLYELRDRARSA
jgi:hypothetical protein